MAIMSTSLTAHCTPAIIAITAGEPAGIGPDIIIQLAQEQRVHSWVVIGSRSVFMARAKQLGLPLTIMPYLPNEAVTSVAAELTFIDIACPEITAGLLEKEHAEATARHLLAMLDCAIDGCLSGEFAAMVTAPINKQVINDAGIAFTGHTEYLAEKTGTSRVVMMLASDDLRVTLATTHLPLTAVAQAITEESLLETLAIVHKDLYEKFGLEQPRIHVCGLNPHAGEGGYIGREEIDVINPAIDKARQQGINAHGAFSADTAFNCRPLPDAFLAMFHDQGLPVLKYASFGKAVNITLGLPIIRTSVDHGTALDLVGTGQADMGSLSAAIAYAVRMVNSQHANNNAPKVAAQPEAARKATEHAQ